MRWHTGLARNVLTWLVWGLLPGLAAAQTAPSQAAPSQTPPQAPSLAIPLQNPPPQISALPEPLSLDYVLGLDLGSYPSILLADAELAQARAEYEAVDAGNNLRASLSARARWTSHFENTPDKSHDDSSAVLSVSKPLLDFGRTEAGLAAGEANTEAQALLLKQARYQHRVRLMERYFDVLLADMTSSRDTELMTIAYLQWDKKKDRAELGQVSDIDLSEAEHNFQQARVQQIQASQQTRFTRARLAEALNRPEQLSSSLLKPALKLNRELPEVEQLTALALQDNLALQAARLRIEAARQRLERARDGHWPTLTGVVEAGAYVREFGSRDPLAAALVLEVPLYQGGAVQAEVGKQRAALQQAQSQLQEKEYAVRQQVLGLWQQIQLLDAQQQQAKVLTNYRDLYLDRSRAMYEMEMRTDLGDAMARHYEATMKRDEADYRLALAWARLDVLLGQEPRLDLAQPSAGTGGEK